MNSGKQCVGDDLESLSFISENLSSLKGCIHHAQHFASKFNRHLNAKDRVEIASLNARYDEIYWRLFEKFIKKVRAL
jgi:hypothetical protein